MNEVNSNSNFFRKYIIATLALYSIISFFLFLAYGFDLSWLFISMYVYTINIQVLSLLVLHLLLTFLLNSKFAKFNPSWKYFVFIYSIVLLVSITGFIAAIELDFIEKPFFDYYLS